MVGSKSIQSCTWDVGEREKNTIGGEEGDIGRKKKWVKKERNYKNEAGK